LDPGLLAKGAAMATATVAAFIFTVAFYDWGGKVLRKRTTDYVSWMIEMFDRMFLTVSARQCILIIAGSTLISFGIAYWLTRGLTGAWWQWMIRIILMGFVTYGPWGLPTGWNLPKKIINWMWRRRVFKFDELMLDGLTMLSSSLKSGLSLLQGLEMVVKELPNPLSQELALVLSQQRLGVRMEEALNHLEDRIATEDVQIIVTSINILRESGGNLAEVFDTIAYTMRQRRKVEAKIKALTAQGIIQGYVICSLPFGLGYILYQMDQSLVSRLWQTVIGWIILIIMIGLQIAGFYIIKKIVTIEV
jgi:tight adherence protein B